MKYPDMQFTARLVLVGQCQWPVSLRADGRVGDGASHQMTFWWLDNGAICFGAFDGRISCKLKDNGDGSWHGSSTVNEANAVELWLGDGFDRIKALAAAGDEPPGDAIALVGNVHFQDGIGKAILVANEWRNQDIQLKVVTAGCYLPESFPKQCFGEHVRRNTVPRQQVPATSAVFAYLPPPDSAAAMPQVRGPRICFTMFEADRAPAGWDEACRQFDQILCPAPFFVDALHKSGMRTPAAVVPLGVIEPAAKSQVEKRHKPFVFATSNSTSPRKNLDGLIQAFLAAFPIDPDVRLVIQSRWGSRRQEIEALAGSDPRIESQWGDLSDDEYETWWASIDCYVALSKAEGYGLTPREAILRGLPVIASDNSGHATIPKEYYFPVPSTGMEPAYCDYWTEPVGRYWTPDLNVAAQHMRYIYENYEAALAKPRCARADSWADRISFKAMADRVLPYLRSQVIMLCPSIGKECGIAEYTRYVQRELVEAGIGCLVIDNVRRACELALAAASVTHVIIQHEYALFDGRNPRLAEGDSTGRLIQELKHVQTARADVAVAVLIHTYSESTQESDLNRQLLDSGLPLFHFTHEGAERFGCATFEHGVPQIEGFQPAERPDGRRGQLTIGNFGFFGIHRDLDAVVDVCRRTNSRFVGSFRCDEPSAEAEVLQQFHSAGVQAELTWGFPKDTELLALLSQCDLLYMPRRDNGLWNASGSVRLAMSLRRPIIVNSARCYSDLADVLCMAGSIDEAAQWVERLRDPAQYAAAVARIDRFARDHSITNVYRRLLADTAKPRSPATNDEKCDAIKTFAESNAR